MSEDDTDDRRASPTPVSAKATGGAGTLYEYRIAGRVLAALALGARVPGLPSPVAAVGLQRRAAGHVIDDIVAHTSVDGTGPRIDYSVKYTVHPRPSDDQFVNVVTQFVDLIDADSEAVASGDLKVGLVAAAPTTQLGQLKELTRLADGHDTSASMLTQIQPGATNADLRQRYHHVRSTVQSVAAPEKADPDADPDGDLLTHGLLRALQVWIIDDDPEGPDTTELLDRLARELPEGIDERDALRALVSIAEQIGPTGGLITLPSLRARMYREGVPMEALAIHQPDLDALRRFTEATLDATSTSLAHRLHLPRAALHQALREAIAAGGTILVHGQAGVGKSVLAREVVKGLADRATVFALDVAGRQHHTLADLIREIGADLATTLRHAPTSGPCIVLIDGAEHIVRDGGPLLTAILRAIPAGDAPDWTVIVTARTDARDAIARHLTDQRGESPLLISVGELDDSEIAEVLETFPALAPLDRHPRSRRLLARLYIIDLLLRAGPDLDLDRPMGEEHVMDLVWERLIRRDGGAAVGQGNPDDRSAACRVAAEALATTGTVGALEANGEALAGLVSDDILERTRTLYRFSHDVLADYAVAYWLLEDDSRQFLEHAPNPRQLLRAVRLAMQRRLADGIDEGSVKSQWGQALRQADDLATTDGPRWNDVPYEALLQLGDPGSILGALESRWRDPGGEDLGRLLDVTLRYAITDDVDATTHQPVVDAGLAAPVVDLLARLGDRLPNRLTLPALKLTQRWLRATTAQPVPDGGQLPDPGELAAAVTGWAQDVPWGDPLEFAQVSMALLTGLGHTPDDTELFERSFHRSRDLGAVVEDPHIAAVLAHNETDLLLRLAGQYYLDLELTVDPSQTPPPPEPEPSSLFDTLSHVGDDGVQDHLFRFSRPGEPFASADYGPFAALLRESPRHGIRLISEVVDTATAARADEQWDQELTLTLSDGSVRTYRGTGQVWPWYRGTGTGAYPAMSALMALRRWALEQTTMRPLREVVDDILRCGESLAVAAVAMSIPLSCFEDVTDELDQFLEHPLVWECETARVTAESSGLAAADAHVDLLRKSLDEVALRLVLSADPERQDELKQVGDRLIERAREESAGEAGTDEDGDRVLVARRRAAMLDIDRFRAKHDPDSDQVLIEVKPDEDVRARLEASGGEAARLHLRLSSDAFTAVRLRDGEDISANPMKLWHDIVSTLDRLQELGVASQGATDPLDALAAAGGAAMLASMAGDVTVDDDLAQQIVEVLIEACTYEPANELEAQMDSRDTVWDHGSDRSAATVLPALLVEGEILQAAGVDRSRVVDGLQRLAGSLFAETRQRLVSAVRSLLDATCSDESDETHPVAMQLAVELLATSGLGELTGYRRQRRRLDEPIEEHLDTDEIVVDLRAAADAVPLLTDLSSLGCSHSRRAEQLIRALVEHDLRVWPAQLGGEPFNVGGWRHHMDRYVAACVLDGRVDLLDEYLVGFATCPEDLTGLLESLAEVATSKEQAASLLRLWQDQVFPRLLPDVRPEPADPRRRPSLRQEAALDRSLLPKPPETAAWPIDEHFRVIVRWSVALAARPHAADRLIEVLAPYGYAVDPTGVSLILMVLGDSADRILRDSRYALPWIQALLSEHAERTAEVSGDLQRLLDRVAETGNAEALRIQRQLEI